ncbi:MAG: hypothetical protein ACFFAO_20740 [Candidatus Hermodarchaeota archaeon]
MPSIEKDDNIIEIRVFLRKEREDDTELFEMFKSLSEEFKPIKYGELGKMVLYKAFKHWYKNRKKEL